MVATSCLTAPLGAGGCPLLISGSVSFSSRLRLLLRYCSKQQTPRQAIKRSSPPSSCALPLIGLLEPLAAVAATRVLGGIGDTSTMESCTCKSGGACELRQGQRERESKRGVRAGREESA